jgi:uncharacterized membrane protein (GlpM family)
MDTISYLLLYFLYVCNGLLLGDFLHRHFPNEFQDVMFNVLVWVSRAERWVVKACSPLKPVFSLVASLFSTRPTHGLSAIKDGVVLSSYETPSDYDMLLFYFIDLDGVMHFRSGLTNSLDQTLVPSSVKFVMVEVCELSPAGERKIGDKPLRLELKTKTYNCYVVDNLLNYDFFVFLMNKQGHNVTKDAHLLVKLLDHNVNEATIHLTPDDQGKGILFGDKDYQLCLSDTIVLKDNKGRKND